MLLSVLDISQMSSPSLPSLLGFSIAPLVLKKRGKTVGIYSRVSPEGGREERKVKTKKLSKLET